MENDVSRFLLQLRRKHPFLASLSLFAEIIFTNTIGKFDTDGRTIRINRDYFEILNNDEKCGLLLHLVLHCALLHAVRRINRDENIWNVAADIVVNNVILESRAFPPPHDTVIDTKFNDQSVEQVYETLKHRQEEEGCGQHDGDFGTALSNSDNGCDVSDDGVDQQGTQGNSNQESSDDSPAKAHSAAFDHQGQRYQSDLRKPDGLDQQGELQRQNQHWRAALQRAETADQLNSAKGRGDIGANLLREINVTRLPQIDWRTQLWRHMVRTPTDFVEFDRRFMHAGLYLEQLAGDKVTVDIAVDTSGSIEDSQLIQFMSEVNAIVRSYEHVSAQIYYVDAEVHGPFPLNKFDIKSMPIGGGGTDFSTFFHLTRNEDVSLESSLCVYFTDGDGHFPSTPPQRPVLWVVTAGGERDDYFPFGDVARLAY